MGAAGKSYFPQWLDVKIYPNPVKDIINIFTEYDSRWIGKVIDVIDMNGKIVLKTSIKSSNQSINTSRLAPGVYFIRLEKDDEKVMRKFVKL